MSNASLVDSNASISTWTPGRTTALVLLLIAGGIVIWAAADRLLIDRQPIVVGILHSETGPMAVSERSMIDAEVLALEQINASGGLLGRPVRWVIADGASDWPTFAREADRLINDERAEVIFGCWTSASRKSVLPVVEAADHLLVYPMAYEGLETSPQVIYTGAAPNQQITPAVQWCHATLEARRFFLIGSDYIWPHCVNAIISDQLAGLGAEKVGEAYIPFGSTDVDQFVSQIRDAKPDVVLCSVVGDSVLAFFDALKDAGIDPEEIQDPEKTFSLDQFIAVLEFGMEQTGDPYYGLKLGKEPHIAGTIGMMCASCRNLKEAYIQGCKYFRVQGDFATIEFMDDRQYPGIRYTPAQSWILKSPETVRQEIEAMFSFLVSILKINSNHVLRPFRISFAADRPSDLTVYKEVFGIVPLFDQKENVILFRSQDLLIPMKAFNPETFELLRMHIETQVKRISGASLVSEKVRSILLSSLRYRFPDINTVASKLNMSPRTLQRQLNNEQTSFKILLQDTRFNLAKHLLNVFAYNQKNLYELQYQLNLHDLP